MRPDGKRVKAKDVETMYLFVPRIMPHRYDAMNMTTVDIPVEPLQKYLNEQRKQGRQLSHMGLIIAAYTRVMREFPELNRFIVNKKIYDRTETTVSMVVLKPGQDDGTMNKIFLDQNDNVFQVQEKIDAYIAQNRAEAVSNSTDKLMKLLLSVPGLTAVAVAVLKWMDKHGLMPKSIIDASPFHASLLVSNLASIRTNHIYHHVYDFGTTSVGITMGNLREVPKRKGNEVEFERCIPLGVVMDERICSGVYFANAFRRLKSYLADPALLETNADMAKV